MQRRARRERDVTASRPRPDRASDPRRSPVLDLQRTAGNRAVSAIIQRVELMEELAPADTRPPETIEPTTFPAEDATELEPAGPGETTEDVKAPASGGDAVKDVPAPSAAPLKPGQVAAAMGFYAGKKSEYTPEIITQIQGKVGTEPTGTMDPDTVQGVAVFQAAHGPLKVDGMAGARTLPMMFPTGLAAKASVDEYVKKAKGVATDWASLGTADARAAALMSAANEQLTAASVPLPIVVVGDAGGAAGAFEHATWTITLDRAAFAVPTIEEDESISVSGTVYHECRHAEQFHKIARMLATKGMSAAAISKQTSMPPNITQNAVDNPLPRNTPEFTTAEEQYLDRFGAGAQNFRQAEDDVVAKKNALNAAQKAFDDNPTAANKAKRDAAKAAFNKAFLRYRNLTLEADAFATEDKVGDTWLDMATP